MSRILGPRDGCIHVEAKDHAQARGLIYPLPSVPTENSLDWSDDEDYYNFNDFTIDTDYGFDSSDYDNQMEYLAGL